ncbi:MULTISPECIES: nuclear transport factor 2 family protein [unclassified Nocardiopsis]|uniref:nuclear transport factor 2 family protein n=1 Tax=Nocardiopsis TaxID=2013 RepID=UPI00387A9E20
MTSPGTIAETDLLLEVQHFYARQMHHLDEGRVEEWAATFTEDGVFAANAHPEPATGRAAITAAARATTEQLARDRVRRRHWLGMLDVRPGADGTITAVSYAQILSTRIGDRSELLLSCTCEDVLVREGGELLVRHRQVRRDDIE